MEPRDRGVRVVPGSGREGRLRGPEGAPAREEPRVGGDEGRVAGGQRAAPGGRGADPGAGAVVGAGGVGGGSPRTPRRRHRGGHQSSHPVTAAGCQDTLTRRTGDQPEWTPSLAVRARKEYLPDFAGLNRDVAAVTSVRNARHFF